MQIVVAQSGIDRDLFVAPNGGLIIPDFPVVRVVAVVNNIAGETDEGGVRRGDGLHQSDAHGWIRGVDIFGIVKASVAIGHEAERSTHVELQINRRLRDRPLRTAHQPKERGDQEEQGQRARRRSAL